jgi:hypothetical protein
VGEAKRRELLSEQRTRMNGMCATCKHFYPMPGECRESSPVPILLGIDPKRGPIVNGFHPPVRPNHSCGKHQLGIQLPGNGASLPALESAT